MLVEKPVPATPAILRKAVTEHVGPNREHLPVDALLGHPREAPLYGLDQRFEERPQLQPVVELQRAATGGRLLHERHAELRGARFQRLEDARRNVVGVNVGRHARWARWGARVPTLPSLRTSTCCCPTATSRPGRKLQGAAEASGRKFVC